MGGLITTGQFVRFMRAGRARLSALQHGFTIVEVMIVMAVTGALFVAAAILISGKQNQAAFNQGIQQIQSQIQQVMNEVSTGYFPDSANFSCTAPAGGPVSITSAGSTGQGANAGCIFAGKVIQLKLGAGVNPERYAVYTLAGAQKNSSGNEVTSLTEAVPKVIAPGDISPSGFPDISTSTVMQNGLTTSANGMWYNNGAGDISIGAVAFVPSFAEYSSGTITSGSQHMSVVAIGGTNLGMTEGAAVDAINSNITSGVSDPTNGVFVCFASGGTNQSGLITIGGGGHPLSVTLKVMQGTTTCGR